MSRLIKIDEIKQQLVQQMYQVAGRAVFHQNLFTLFPDADESQLRRAIKDLLDENKIKVIGNEYLFLQEFAGFLVDVGILEFEGFNFDDKSNLTSEIVRFLQVIESSTESTLTEVEVAKKMIVAGSTRTLEELQAFIGLVPSAICNLQRYYSVGRELPVILLNDNIAAITPYGREILEKYRMFETGELTVKPMVFISHITEEKAAALWLKDKLIQLLGNTFEVFVASDQDSIPPGTLWYSWIESNIMKSTIVIILISPESQHRPWINFEAGIAHGNGVRVVPIGYCGVETTGIDLPLSGLQTIMLKNSQEFMRIFRDCADVLSLTLPTVDWSSLFQAFGEIYKDFKYTSPKKSELMEEKAIQEFIAERISMLEDPGPPVHLPWSGFIVFHAIPRSPHEIDIQEESERRTSIEPITGSGTSRLSSEGLILHNSLSYALIFRDGIIEWVDAELLNPNSETDVKFAPLKVIEKHLVEIFKMSIYFYKSHHVAPPIYYQSSLVNVRGYRTSVNSSNSLTPPFKEDEIHFLEITLDDFDKDLQKICQHSFEVLWNAFGLTRSRTNSH